MALSEERKKFIRGMSNGEWADEYFDVEVSDEEMDRLEEEWDAKQDAFCKSHSNSEELHYFAETANWDFVIGSLRDIIRNPACEAGTALYIYWGAQPLWYTQYETAEDVEAYERESFELIQEIQKRYLAGEFAVDRVSFDPSIMLPHASRPPSAHPNTQLNVPDRMLEPVTPA